MMLLLTLSLVGLLVSPWLALPHLFVLSIVTTLSSLAGLAGTPKWLHVSFWIWLNCILLYLLSTPAPEEAHGAVALIAGLPAPAFWMLIGIWIVPVFIWPLGFLLTFKAWLKS